jgi:hypothetical protein
MQEFPINGLALLVAAIVKFVLGAVWYSPIAFGPRWRRLTGCTEGDAMTGLGKAMAVDFIASLVMAFVLVHAVHYAGAATLGMGAAVGFFNWLGFIGATTLAASVYEKRPLALWAINNAYLLLALLIMGAILAIWP